MSKHGSFGPNDSFFSNQFYMICVDVLMTSIEKYEHCLKVTFSLMKHQTDDDDY